MKKNKDVLKKKYISVADKKGIALIIFLAAVVIALLVVDGKAFKNDTTKDTSYITESTQNSTSTQAPETTAMPVETTSAPVSEKDEDETTKPENPTKPSEKAELSKEDILKKVGDGVNSLKSTSASFKAVKTQVMDIDLIDCSIPRFTGVVNSVIQRFIGDEVLEYDFTNGVGIDPEEKSEMTSKQAIPPTDKDFTLTMEGLQDAYMKKEGENTTYTIVVVPEKGTLENPRPKHHSSACDTMDISLVEIPMGAITRADYDYAGAVVSVTYDKNGKVTKYYEKLSIAGIGEGKAIGFTGSATIEGFMEETWDISWK